MSLLAHCAGAAPGELALAARHASPHAQLAGLSRNARRLVAWLAERQEATVADAITATDVAAEEAHALLTELEELGVVAHHVRDRVSTFRLSAFHRDLVRDAQKPPPPTQKLRSDLLSGMTDFVALQIVSLTLTYSTQMLIARWYGEAEYGWYSLVLTAAAVLAYVAGLGFPTGGMQRFMPQYVRDGSWGLFKGLLLRSSELSLLAGVFIGIVAAAAAWWGPDLTVAQKGALVLGAVLVPVEAVSQIFASVFQSLKRWIASYFSDQVFVPAVFLLLVFGLWMSGRQISAFHLVALALGTHAVAVVVQFGWLRGVLPAEMRQAGRQDRMREWLKTSLPLMAATLLGVIVYRADLLVVGWLMDSANAGFYAAVLVTAEIFGVFLKGANNVSTPSIAPLFHQGDKTTLQYLMGRVAAYAFFPTLLGTVVCGLGATWILGLFGDAFVVGRGALIVLLITQLLKAAFGAPTMLVVMSGQQVRVAQIYLSAAFIDLVLLYLLVPRFGLIGASIASLAAVATTQIVLSSLAYRHAGIDTTIFGALRSGPATTR